MKKLLLLHIKSTTTALDAKLYVPLTQPPGSYSGTVVLMFSNV